MGPELQLAVGVVGELVPLLLLLLLLLLALLLLLLVLLLATGFPFFTKNAANVFVLC